MAKLYKVTTSAERFHITTFVLFSWLSVQTFERIFSQLFEKIIRLSQL